MGIRGCLKVEQQSMDLVDIVIRLLIAMIMAGIIGYDREHRNKPAGFRTHIMVCVGATIVALVQVQISDNALKLASANSEISNTFVYEQGRLVAQVISGIGFLGAGTIIVTKKFAQGLTTAASLWAVACLGIAIGMGFYVIAISGFIIIVITLIFLNKVINFAKVMYIEINFTAEKTRNDIATILENNQITVKDTNFSITKTEASSLYYCQYTVEVKDLSHLEKITEQLYLLNDVNKVTLLNV